MTKEKAEVKNKKINKTNQNTNKKKHGIKLYLMFWLFLTGVFGVMIASSLDKRIKYMRQGAQIQKQIEEKDNMIEILNSQLQYTESDAYVEKLARERLGLVKPDEILFIID